MPIGRPRKDDYEMRRRCVAWDRCGVSFFGLQATPIPAHLQRASWLEIRSWLRSWIRKNLGATPEQELAVMNALREVPRWEQYMINGLPDPRAKDQNPRW